MGKKIMDFVNIVSMLWYGEHKRHLHDVRIAENPILKNDRDLFKENLNPSGPLLSLVKTHPKGTVRHCPHRWGSGTALVTCLDSQRFLHIKDWMQAWEGPPRWVMSGIFPSTPLKRQVPGASIAQTSGTQGGPSASRSDGNDQWPPDRIAWFHQRVSDDHG